MRICRRKLNNEMKKFSILDSKMFKCLVFIAFRGIF